MKTFLVDRIIDSNYNESKITPISHIGTYRNLSELYGYLAETIVKKCEIKVSASGAVIFFIEIEPIELENEQISQIYKYMNFRPNLRKGDKLAICRSWNYQTHVDIYLLASNKFHSNPRIPCKCPECGSLLVKLDYEIPYCQNFSCLASLLTILRYWWAWEAWEEKLLQKQTPQLLDFINYQFACQLIENLQVKSVADLYQLSVQQISQNTFLSQQEATEIINALNYSKTCKWTYILRGLRIRFIGYSSVAKLEQIFSNLEDIAAADLSVLKSINWNDSSWNCHKAQSIYSWFKIPSNLELLQCLKAVGLQVSSASILHNDYYKSIPYTKTSFQDPLPVQPELNSNYEKNLIEFKETSSDKYFEIIFGVNGQIQKFIFNPSIQNYSNYLKNTLYEIAVKLKTEWERYCSLNSSTIIISSENEKTQLSSVTKENLGYDYIRIIATAASFEYRPTGKLIDNESIDATIDTTDGYSLWLQIKTISKPNYDNHNIKYELKIKNYNDLRGRPRVILIIVVVPEYEHESINDIELQAYWISTEKWSEIENTSSKTISIPIAQTFDIKSIKEIMNKIREKKPL